MRLTMQDVGRVIRKRDNLMRRFVVTHVEGDKVTLEDLIFGQTFTITDVHTYEYAQPTHGRGNHEAT